MPAPLSLTLPLDPVPFAREVRLGPVDVEALLQEDLDNPDPYGRLRIGIIRTVEISAPDGQWHALPDGEHLWTLAVVSEEAVGVRLHVSDGALPVGGELRFISAADTSRVEGPFTNTGPLGTGTFWSTTFWGDGVYVEYRTPPAMAAPPGSVPFAIDKLQHLYRDPGSALPGPRVGDCHHDIMCYHEDWITLGNAVAAVAFVDEPYVLECTGELLNTVAGDWTPYLLTAGHCIDTQLAAESMMVYWKYQTESCDGDPPDLQSAQCSTVGDLLATKWDATHDYSLIMILGEFPPESYTWAGWNAGNIADGAPLSCIHHPDGSFMRFDFGTKTLAGPPPAGFMRLDWIEGAGEHGSSGSGAYLSTTQQLLGVLSYGPATCEDMSWDDFCSFTYIYEVINSYLQSGSDDIFEPNDDCASAAEVAPSTYPGLVLKLADEDWYRVMSSSCGPVEILLDFTDDFGNIDMELYDTCGGSLVAASYGTGNSEAITIPPGPSREYRLRVYLASSVRNTYMMTVTATAGGTVVYPIDAGELLIPDNYTPGVDHSFFVPDHIIFAGLKVAVKITHTWNGDLRVRLTHDGTTVTLIDRPGFPEHSYGFDNDGFDVLLDDAAFMAIEDYDSGGLMVVGTFRPNELLSVFNGQDAYGQWTLNVADLEELDLDGTLDEWALHVPPEEPCECGGDGDVNGDTFTDMADFASFQGCFTGTNGVPPPPGCQVLNFDCDQDVDLEDFSAFLDAFSGPVRDTSGDPIGGVTATSPVTAGAHTSGDHSTPANSSGEASAHSDW